MILINGKTQRQFAAEVHSAFAAALLCADILDSIATLLEEDRLEEARDAIDESRAAVASYHAAVGAYLTKPEG